MELYQKTEDSDSNSIAQLGMGYMYQHGFGIEQRNLEALRWHEMSANQGNPDAQLCVGIFVCDVLKYSSKYNIVMHWLKKAADNSNSAEVQYRISCLYKLGHGAQQNYSLAFQCYTKSAN